MGMIGAVLLWLAILGGMLARMTERSMFGGEAPGWPAFLLVLLSLPVMAWLMGLFIRESQLVDEEVVMALPGIGWLYELFFNPQSYYRHDTALMFRDSVARAVNEVINGLLEEKGLRALSADDLMPTVRDLVR